MPPDPDDIWRAQAEKAQEATILCTALRAEDHPRGARETILMRLRELYPGTEFTWDRGGLHVVTPTLGQLPKGVKFTAVTIRERLSNGDTLLRKNVGGPIFGDIGERIEAEPVGPPPRSVWDWLKKPGV
jgi:hypothetical protein